MLKTLFHTDPASFVPMGGVLPTLSVKLQISDDEAGAVIGKGGETVRAIKADTGVMIKVVPQREMPATVRYRLCVCMDPLFSNPDLVGAAVS